MILIVPAGTDNVKSDTNVKFSAKTEKQMFVTWIQKTVKPIMLIKHCTLTPDRIYNRWLGFYFIEKPRHTRRGPYKL